MAEDTSQWDVFLDKAKFERREEILAIRKKRKVDEELKGLRSAREMNEDNKELQELKNKITRLQEKIDYRDDLLENAKCKEADMQKDMDQLSLTIEQKDAEIGIMSEGIYQIEVL
jgi:chromosome segregation ATPase